jgi:hypothetical protein
MIAGVSAIALFIISFLPWFGISGGVVVQGVGAVGGSKNFSLWEAENPLDIYLLIVILVFGRIMARARATGMPLSGEFGHIWTVRDGLGTRVQAYRDRNEARKVAGAA